jgi:hypothetical protein
MVGARPTGRGASSAAQAWDQEFGETHNPDGSPKGALPNAATPQWRSKIYGGYAPCGS